MISIFMMKWGRGEKLDMSVSMSLMAMIFYIFISVNALTYMGLTTLQQFLSCVERMSTVLYMEEFEFTERNTDVPNKADVHVKFDDADVGWGFRVKQESVEEKAKRLAT